MKSRRVRGSDFPGDSQDKRAARLFLYRHATSLVKAGAAITLAGTEARSEVELMRDYLRWPKERVWFVDRDKSKQVIKSLKSIRGMWPGVNAVQDDLRNVIPRMGSIGFANLDFMGFLNLNNVLPCLQAVVPNLLPGAIMGLSWFRGRELWNIMHSARLLWKAGSGYRKLNDRRWAGVFNIVEAVSDGTLEFIGGLHYHNGQSPMSVSVYRKR